MRFFFSKCQKQISRRACLPKEIELVVFKNQLHIPNCCHVYWPLVLRGSSLVGSRRGHRSYPQGSFWIQSLKVYRLMLERDYTHVKAFMNDNLFLIKHGLVVNDGGLCWIFQVKFQTFFHVLSQCHCLIEEAKFTFLPFGPVIFQVSHITSSPVNGGKYTYVTVHFCILWCNFSIYQMPVLSIVLHKGTRLSTEWIEPYKQSMGQVQPVKDLNLAGPPKKSKVTN